jgi:DNA helicase-2/ATP-dependent DNA helicase PcrA
MEIFQPSTYQEAIFSWIKESKGDAVVQAVAGSGKTTTLIQCAKIIDSNNCIFLAFNDHIVEELKAKFSDNVQVKTIHSIGFSACRNLVKKDKLCKKKPIMDEDKYLKYIEHSFQLYLNKNKISDIEKRTKFFKFVNTVFGLIRLSLIEANDEKAINNLFCHHDFLRQFNNSFRNLSFSNFKDIFLEYLPFLMEKGKAIAPETIDYNDMVWIPNILNLGLKKYDWILVDEAQDLNKAQLQIVLNSRKPNGRIIFVGDESQAIYGFAGADCNSIKNIIQCTNADTLPLSISYRCPKSHIALAQKIVPQIEAHKNSIEGQVAVIKYEDIFKNVKKGDLIICRNLQPLKKLHQDLIFHSIPSKIQDNKTKNGFIEKVLKFIKPIFPSKVYDFFFKLLSKDKELFVHLSTIHKAKGLEADRIFFLGRSLIPSKFAKMSWELEQENNLEYIALTRAKKELFFVD